MNDVPLSPEGSILEVTRPPSVDNDVASKSTVSSASSNDIMSVASGIGLVTQEEATEAPKSSSWLDNVFSNASEATFGEVFVAFQDQCHMRHCFIAELAKHSGRIQCLISRCFRKTDGLTGTVGHKMATVEEATFHLHCAAQHLSMGEPQRRRQADIASMLAHHGAAQNSLFQATRMLTHDEMNKHHGRSNQHSLWNMLPAPTVQNVGGIGCVSPANAIWHLLAFGVELDNIQVQFQSEQPPPLAGQDVADGDLVTEEQSNRSRIHCGPCSRVEGLH